MEGIWILYLLVAGQAGLWLGSFPLVKFPDNAKARPFFRVEEANSTLLMSLADSRGFISCDQLDEALKSLCIRLSDRAADDLHVGYSEEAHQLTLRRHLRIPSTVNGGGANDDQLEYVMEDDEVCEFSLTLTSLVSHNGQEAASKRTEVEHTDIVYQIMHSSSYQVPVLYFYFATLLTTGVSGIENVYKYLVPVQYRQNLQTVGVLGGIGPVVSAHRIRTVSGT